MDIRNNTNILHAKIRRFTLKATASAILALNAEAVVAASCPAYITADSGLAGVVCDFDITTGSSVTVANGGEVGGIVMTTYTPAPPSSITINAGGVVNNTTGIGITISHSSLSNGISNSGLISAHSLDIQLDHSTINGGIFNSGTMTSTDGDSIQITNASTLNGGISNSG